MIKRAINFKQKYGKNIFRGIATGLDNLLVFYTNKKVKRSPLFAVWDVTFRCNSRCSYCSSWEWGMKNKEKELTTDEAIKVINQLGEMKIWMLSFSGGEPLLRKDIFTLIKKAKEKNINVNLNTNGFFLENFAEELIDSGLDTLTVSVESHDAKIHDSLRNLKDSFNRLERGINKLVALRKKRGFGEKPFIMIRANVSKRNYRELDKYFEYWKKKVDEIMLQPVHEGGEKSFLHVRKKGILFSETDKKDYLKFMNLFFKKHPILNKGYYREFYNFFFNPKMMHEKYRCFAGFFIMQIDPYGNIYPCGELITKLGELRKNNLKDILNNDKSIQFRNLLKNRKNKCFCWYNCTGPLNTPLTKLSKLIPIRTKNDR